ncbi:hypothetical protein EG68_06334 [Paragonimus skrjabini miyazakii]|uniref:C2 domain-containing protein n=1 Tax=Paragonimus skrjabini miyazakii TaxID=59628 RepID=A0A8S9YZS6_9TREM|nr:hypothetical protein EG68_06334 [Paragonimus skrjabini miyazakii]
MALAGGVPKIVSVRVQKAEHLRIIPKEGKQKKITQKWKVSFLGFKKKASTESVLAPAGNPVWDYEVTLKVAVRGEPIVLLVTDSEDHHVGQVVIPVASMPPRPTNSYERPTDASRLRVSDLEPTKKVSNPLGTLYYWVWVEEYRAEDDVKSSRGSVLSLSSLKHSKKSGSVANALNYSGSVLSLSSSQSELKGEKKKHHLFKRKHGKDSLKAAAILSQSPSLGLKPAIDSQQFLRASNSVFDPTSRASQSYGYDPNHDDHDGSVLGAYSDLTGSELYAMGGTNPPTSSGLETVGTASLTPSIPVPNRDSPPRILSPLAPKRISTVREEDVQPAAVIGRSEDVTTRNPDVPKPALLRIEPTSCSTEGDVEVVVYGVGLTEEVMRYAAVLVDGITVQRQDWFIEESSSGQPGHYELRIQMPERPTGRCYIELETMNHGRLRCPQEFMYVQAAAAPSSGVSKMGSSTDVRSVPAQVPPKPDNPKTSELNTTSSLTRMGSQRSSLSVVDRRSTRRDRRVLGAPSDGGPEKNTSELRETEDGSRSKAELHRVDLVDHGASSVNPTNITSALDRKESVTSGLVRRGSQRGSLVMLDRRSTRRYKLNPVTETESEIPLVDKEHNEAPGSLHTATNSESAESTRNSTVSPQTSFRRTGSQRAPIVMLDRRSTRRGRTRPNDGADYSTKEEISESPEKDKIDSNEFRPVQPQQPSMPICDVFEKCNVKAVVGTNQSMT